MESGATSESDATIKAAIASRESAVNTLVASDPAQALRLSLHDPPYTAKDAALKDAALDVVLKAIGAIKEAEIEDAVGALKLEECDVLMKFIYRGLGQPKKGSQYPLLLKWHPIVLKRAGQGAIVRVLTETQRAL